MADDPEELAARLRLAVGRMERRLRRHDAASTGRPALTPSQLSALWSVAHRGPLGLGALADLEAVSPPTLSRSVARLADLGMVTRTPDERDARSARVAISAAGQDLVDLIKRERTATLATRLAALTPAQRAAVGAALPALEDLADGLRAGPLETAALVAG